MKKTIALIIMAAAWIAAGAEELPAAMLKAEYRQITNSLNSKTGKSEPLAYKFVLQIAPSMSYYPQGKIILDQAFSAALQAFSEDRTKDPFKIMKEQGYMSESRYRCRKDFNKGIIRVWDTCTGDSYRYDVDMSDLTWDLLDSTKTVLDYECQLATADYHGRRWEAWFAPEITVSDGPWQLCGLPGLIMEATCEGGLYSFVITGLQQCNEPLKPDFENSKYFHTQRKSVLKMRDYGRRNRADQIRAMTGGKVKISSDANYKGEDDLIETDYH